MRVYVFVFLCMLVYACTMVNLCVLANVGFFLSFFGRFVFVNQTQACLRVRVQCNESSYVSS